MRDRICVDDVVRGLATLDLEGVRAVWSAQFGPPPKLRSVELLRLMLAWRLQAKAHGGLDADTRRQLARRGAILREGRSLGLGAVLRRQYEGRMIEVIVEPDGFRFDGHIHPSLSAVAQAVTGTRWNGPRFFGLRQGSGLRKETT